MAINWKDTFVGLKQQEVDIINNTILSAWRPQLPELEGGRCDAVVAGIVNDVFEAIKVLGELHDDFYAGTAS